MSTVIKATGLVPDAVTAGGNVMKAEAGAIAGPGGWRTAQPAAGVVTAVVPAPVTVTGAGLMNAAWRRLP